VRILSIAFKDINQLARDRKSVLFLLLMPLAFTLFFGLAYRSFTTTGETDGRPVVAIDNRDAGDVLSDDLVTFLAAAPTLRLEELGADADVQKLVEGGVMNAVVTVPSGYGASLLGERAPPLDVVADAGTAEGTSALTALDTSVQRFLGTVQIAILAQQAVGDDVADRTDVGALDSDAVMDAALSSARVAWREPPIVVSASGVPTDTASLSPANPYAQASPGMIVQFAIYGLILSAMLLVLERKTGALARLVGTPTSRAEIIAGHVLAMFVVVFLQIAVLVTFGQFVLGVDYLAHPFAVLLTSAALALWSASLGLLIGSLSRTEDHVVVGSLIAMFVFSAFGGAWFPLEVTGRAFSTIGHLTPGAWAMDAYQSILLRDQGLGAVLQPALVLFGFALLFFVVATWRFEPTT